MSYTIQLLKEAQKYYKNSMIDFTLYQEAEENNDEKTMHLHWTACEHASGVVKGLLKAYEMTTGRKIYEFEIKEELMLWNGIADRK